MSSTTRNVVFLILVIFGMSDAWSEAAAQSASEKGLEIARAAHANNKGFGNSSADLTMILRDRRGQENKRSIRIQVLEVPDEGDKVLFVFDSPRDVKGTAFLAHGHKTKPDDQWLYLPALKRVKRISSSNRSGSFMGSEFSYQDLNYPEVEKYTYTWLKDEKCGVLTCSVTEWVPVEKGSGYTRQLVWHDTKEYRILKIQYYDRRNSHLKTLTYEGYNQYLGQFWRAGKQLMVNHVTGKSTDLLWTNFEFRTDMNERDFSQAGLRRVR